MKEKLRKLSRAYSGIILSHESKEENRFNDMYDFLHTVKEEIKLKVDVDSLSRQAVVKILRQIAPSNCQLAKNRFDVLGFWENE